MAFGPRPKYRASGRMKISCLMMALLLAGCDAFSNTETQAKPRATEPAVRTTVLSRAEIAPKIEGSGAILNPNGLLQFDADLRAAKIAAHYSAAQLDRAQALLKTAVVSQQALETAEKQASTDGVQLKHLENRLRAEWGDEAPFLEPDARRDVVAKLSEGTVGLVRLDFPSDIEGIPRKVQLYPLGGTTATAVEKLWPAPLGNLAMPGVSYFGLFPSAPGLRAGDRARFSAEVGPSSVGVVIPKGAIVLQGGEAWCYLETEPGKYQRKQVPLTLPVEQGYLVQGGFTPGEKVVVRGAALLLAREAEGATGDEGEAARP
jgi:hypothetical protein